MRSGRGFVLLVVLCAGCASRAVVFHQVSEGENLYRIGKAYGIPYEEIARANDLSDPSRIEVGQRLRIPGAKAPVPVDLVTPRNVTEHPPVHDERGTQPPKFRWPLAEGTVTSEFGKRRGAFHDGVDIAAPAGTPVLAAASGEVAYSAKLAGYGNVIILRHADGYATVYAHNQRNEVSDGAFVREGQPIATVGRSGHASAPHLHFEIRKDNVARNPAYYLPPTLQADRTTESRSGG